MPEANVFTGFPRECVTFFRGLAAHNEKTWFEGHKDEYERYVKAPAAAFVAALGGRLKKLAPGIHAEPAVNKSIFRINRDVRFSADKRPYKTHLGIWLWEGGAPRMECSGFYFHLEPPRITLGAGVYMFPQAALERYRRALVGAKSGPALARVVAALEEAGYELGGTHYKKVPAGYAADAPLARLLLHNGLYASLDAAVPTALYTPAFVEYCFQHYRAMAPLHGWLRDNVTGK